MPATLFPTSWERTFALMSFVTPKMIVSNETIAMLFASDSVDIRRFAAALNNALQETGKVEIQNKDLIPVKTKNDAILAQLRKH
jgi:hypothetical protein